MRQPYHEDQDVLLESSLTSRDPLKLFAEWFEEAKSCPTISEPNAVCLASADKNGLPSARMVLLKAFGSDGFKIFTNFVSKKGKQMLENPNAALLFYWDPLKKQIRIEGKVEPLPDMEAKEYFETRPKRSQIAAAISEQSSPVQSRQVLIDRYHAKEEKFAEASFVPKPASWGGFKIIPSSFEFWQGQSSRLHDRISFRRPRPGETPDGEFTTEAEQGWFMERLQP